LERGRNFSFDQSRECSTRLYLSLSFARISFATSFNHSFVCFVDQTQVVKFPVGTQQRWEKISQYVETQSVDSVIKMVKNLKNRKTPLQEDERKFQKTPKAQKVIESPLTTREDTPAPTTAPTSAATASKQQQPAATANTNAASTPSSASSAPAASGTATTAATSTNAVPSQGPPMEGWTKVQHAQMEVAMKKFPQTDSERWVKITAEVPGKTKQEVIAHYKDLVTFYKSQKK
jgi:hypothetical protein